MKKHVIVISVDALSTTELDIIQSLPNFKKFFLEGAYAKSVTSVYPSITYTCHSSIITGTYPDKHGIFSNYKFQPEKEEPDWFWYSKDIRVKTLVDYVKEKGGTIGSSFWPVMGANPNIDWNNPEIWSNTPDESSVQVNLRTGTKKFMVSSALRSLHIMKGLLKKEQPELDEFITISSEYMLKKYKPNLALIHLIAHDHEKHVESAEGPHVEEQLLEADKRIERIINATKKAGYYDDCTFVILGDHSSLSYHTAINLNALFKDKGLITLDEEGKLKDWSAFAACCDGSAQIFVNKPSMESKVYDILNDFMNSTEGIEAIYDRHALKENFHVEGQFAFMVEAKKGYCMGKSTEFSPQIEKVKDAANRGLILHKGHHGYSPFKENYQTLFAMKGKDINHNCVIDHMNLVDIAPTLAQLFGIHMTDVDGQCKKEFFKDA